MRIAVRTADPGSSNRPHESSRERLWACAKLSGLDAAEGRPKGARVLVVDETEFDAAREFVGVGNPSASAVACGDCALALLLDARNSIQDAEAASLLAAPFVAVNTVREYGCS